MFFWSCTIHIPPGSTLLSQPHWLILEIVSLGDLQGCLPLYISQWLDNYSRNNQMSFLHSSSVMHFDIVRLSVVLQLKICFNLNLGIHLKPRSHEFVEMSDQVTYTKFNRLSFAASKEAGCNHVLKTWQKICIQTENVHGHRHTHRQTKTVGLSLAMSASKMVYPVLCVISPKWPFIQTSLECQNIGKI